jgi:hypothetical protein
MPNIWDLVLFQSFSFVFYNIFIDLSPLCWFPCDDLFVGNSFLYWTTSGFIFIASLLSLGNLGHVPRSGRHFTRHFTNFTSARWDKSKA